MEAYEQGRIQPDMATLDHIMRALGHTIEFQVQQFHPYSGDVDALAAQWGWFMTDAGAGSTEEWHTPEGDLRAWRLPSGETWVHPDFAPVN
jgi:transcriptional regulator with XRE-family HTH domain